MLHAAFPPCMEPAPRHPGWAWPASIPAAGCTEFSDTWRLLLVQGSLLQFKNLNYIITSSPSKYSLMRPSKYSLNNYITTTRYCGHHFNRNSISLFFFCQTNSSEASLGKLNACMSQLPDRYWYCFAFSSSRQGNKIHFCVSISQGSVWKHVSHLELYREGTLSLMDPLLPTSISCHLNIGFIYKLNINMQRICYN